MFEPFGRGANAQSRQVPGMALADALDYLLETLADTRAPRPPRRGCSSGPA